MALRELVEGDCGGTNSLVRLTSHFVQDHGLKEEGFHHPYPHNDSITSSNTEQLVQQFMEETVHGQSVQPFRMDTLLAEMRELEGRTSPVRSPPVSQLATEEDAQNWAQQYLDAGKVFQENNDTAIWAMEPDPNNEFPCEEVEEPNNDEVHELGFGPRWAEEYLQASTSDTNDEPQLADLSASEDYSGDQLREAAIAIAKSVDDPRFTYSKFMRFMKRIGEGEVTIDSAGNVLSDDESSMDIKDWTGEFLNETAGTAPTWTREFSAGEGGDGIPDEAFSNNLWAKLSQQWEKLVHSDPDAESWSSEFSDYSYTFKEYTFTPENPFFEESNPLEEGKKKLEEGDLPSAVLYFEAAVMKEPENALAWQLLGTTQAENEQDPQAISALKKCVQLDSKNLTALMALAVSYTNENYQNQACRALKEWILANPKYSDLVPPETESSSLLGISSIMTRELHSHIKDLLLEAARRNPGQTIDPDVQCGLGVLFNLTSETDRAVDCFRAALQVRPDDFRLWNRLGATLANGGRSEEAVAAYRNALELSPGFIRARYNLGITCIHLGAHREAAEHLLTALNQQAAGRGLQGEKSVNMSDTIWTTLRLVTSLLERPDLIPSINTRDLTRLNQEFGIE